MREMLLEEQSAIQHGDFAKLRTVVERKQLQLERLRAYTPALTEKALLQEVLDLSRQTQRLVETALRFWKKAEREFLRQMTSPKQEAYLDRTYFE